MAYDITFGSLFAIGSFVNGYYGAKRQQKVEEGQIELELAATRAQAEQVAFQNTKALRQSIASNVTAFAQGGRSDTALLNTTSESYQNYNADQGQLALASEGAQAKASADRYASKAQQHLAQNKAALGALTKADDLNLFKADTWSDFNPFGGG